MEVKIGVQHAPREIVLESGQTPEEVERAVSEALAGKSQLLSLVDDHGRKVLVPVSHGSIGAAGRRSFSAIGDTTNLGARLQGAAGSGEIVVGEATWKRLGEAVPGEPLAPLRVKGKSETVRAWRLQTA